MKPNVWMYLFFCLLVVAVITIAYQDMRRTDAPLVYYKEKYEDLEMSYVDLAKSHSYVLETMMKNNVDLQPYLRDFAGKPREEYVEYLRRRIVAMQLDIDRIERTNKK